jgi:cytochrome c oxidase subunit I
MRSTPQAIITEQHEAIPHGWRRWVYATNHKDIGTMYLVFACAMWLVGGHLRDADPAGAVSPWAAVFRPPVVENHRLHRQLVMNRCQKLATILEARGASPRLRGGGR